HRETAGEPVEPGGERRLRIGVASLRVPDDRRRIARRSTGPASPSTRPTLPAARAPHASGRLARERGPRQPGLEAAAATAVAGRPGQLLRLRPGQGVVSPFT